MNTLHKSFVAIAITSGLALSNAASAETSREAVAGDSIAARSGGALNPYVGEDSGSVYLSRQPWTPTRTRAEVVAELKAAQRRGEVAAMNCEDSGSAYLSRNGQTGAAPQVYAGPNIGAERAAEQDRSPQVVSR